MINIHVTPDDLVKMRFAYRPLLEIPLSYRVFINPEFQAPYRRWVEEAGHAISELDLPYLSALVSPHGYIPDFLTPTPTSKRTDIEADFKELLRTPDEVVREGIFELIEAKGDSEIRRHFLIHPRAALWCLVEELREYWQRTLAHYWTRMITTLEGDVLYRARQLALSGHGELFSELHASIDFCGVTQPPLQLWNTHSTNCNAHGCFVATPDAVAQKSIIQMKPVCQHIHQDIELELNGEGIQLVPVVFRGCGRMYQFADSWQPMIAYGARGGGLWYQKAASPTQSLELAMGAGRATVLRTLRTPASNGEVAYRARISAATANQHLMRLVKAGLVRSNRSGKRVYYSLTERGENLLALFDAVD